MQRAKGIKRSLLETCPFVYTSLVSRVVSEMTYTVSSGTLNSSIPYHTLYQEIQARKLKTIETSCTVYTYYGVAIGINRS